MPTRPRHPHDRKNLLLLTLAVAFSVLCLAGLDRTLMRFMEARTRLPRTQHSLFKTTEFEYAVDLNAYGFRDGEFPPEPSDAPDTIRIAVVGDSFTYGSGVEEPDAWPRVLERILRSRGHRVRVINLGKPGAGPADYADTVFRMIPVVRPHILLAALLQGDDLAQMKAFHADPCAAKTARIDGPPRNTSFWGLVRSWAGLLVKSVLPHTLGYRWNKSHTQPRPLDLVWREMASEVLEKFNPEQRKRFLELDESVRDMFLEGNLNPALVQISVTDPRYLLETWDLESDRTSTLVASMVQCLSCIRTVCVEHGAFPVVVTVPYGAYADRNDYRSREKLGFMLLPEMLTADHADQAVARAAARAGIRWESVQDAFRLKAAEAPLFFQWDGHFNAQGHRAYAELVANRLEGMVQSTRFPEGQALPESEGPGTQ
jgi:hypothetical protein